MKSLTVDGLWFEIREQRTGRRVTFRAYLNQTLTPHEAAFDEEDMTPEQREEAQTDALTELERRLEGIYSEFLIWKYSLTEAGQKQRPEFVTGVRGDIYASILTEHLDDQRSPEQKASGLQYSYHRRDELPN
jgi:hypothetical protein